MPELDIPKLQLQSPQKQPPESIARAHYDN